MELQPSIVIAIISLFYDYNKKNWTNKVSASSSQNKKKKKKRFNLLVAFLYGL